MSPTTYMLEEVTKKICLYAFQFAECCSKNKCEREI